MTSVHAYQLDFSSMRRTSATFGSARRDILQPTARSEGANATPRSARDSARSALSEGRTPRPLAELADPTKKHTFHASLNTSGRKALHQANCPVHSYADPPSSLQKRHGVAFSRMPTGRGLPPLPQASPRTSLLAPDYDAATRPGQYHASFSGVPRQLGAHVVSTPVHAYATPSPMGKKAFKATFGTDSRFDDAPPVSKPAHAHYTPSPMGKKAFKATFGTASRFGSGSCAAEGASAAAPRPLPLRPQSVRSVPSEPATAAVAELEATAAEVEAPLQPPTPKPPARPLVEVVVPVAKELEEKELEPFMPLSARLSAHLSARRSNPSPWRNALPLPDIMHAPAEVAGAA